MLARYECDKALIPASILKTVTCATALEKLGPDFRFNTAFKIIGDNPQSGEGDLVVFAGADPTTGSREFKESIHLPDSIVAALSEQGISFIKGDIRINGDILPEGGGVLGEWEVEDISESYGVGLYPFNWLDNYFESDYVIPSPPEYFVEQLLETMAAADFGVEENDYDAQETLQPDTLTVYEHTSSTLKEIMHSLMVRSDNLMAEGVFRALAPYAVRDSAISIVKNYWNGKGIHMDNMRLIDGSGLARGNTISAYTIGKILTRMAKSPHAKDYVSLFPKAGREGTVKRFLAKTRLEGRMAIKSGTMKGVHCYAGYLLKGNALQPTHTVVIMVNNFYCVRSQLRKAIENYLLNTLPK